MHRKEFRPKIISRAAYDGMLAAGWKVHDHNRDRGQVIVADDLDANTAIVRVLSDDNSGLRVVELRRT